ncbi:MAG: MMPL family transporter [Actinomycetota bacterium]|nr:MMPL family transporter [Actinomycetota bacterium]
MLARLAHAVHGHRKLVVGVWILLTAFGLFATARVSGRWFESFSIPGYSAYETNQKALKTFGTGEQAPLVAVLKSAGDVTKQNLAPAIAKAAAVNPGSRVSSYFDTHSSVYVSRDRHTMFAEIYPPGQNTFSKSPRVKAVRAALRANAPPGVETHLTGLLPMVDASSGGGTGPSVLTEALIGGVGALVILLFVFGTLPAVAIPLAIAVTAILNTFTLVWLLTYVTDVSVIVQFLIALVGLGVAIDYALLMIFRFRDELREGRDVESALVATMRRAGRSVIVSGSTVAVGLLSLLVLPVPFIRSMGLGGMLIPAVSVLAAITLLPAMLAVLGTRINSVRVMPKRLVDRGHPEDGPWGRWARLVLRRPVPVAIVGLAIVAVLATLGTQLNPSESQLKNFPGSGSAIAGRDQLASAGISPGVMKPLDVLVENGGNAQAIAAKVRGVPGVVGAIAPASWHRGADSLVEAFPAVDGSSSGIQGIIDHVDQTLRGGSGTLTGVAAVDRDFVHAIYGNFPYVLAFVLILTLILLARAFRSIVLPI